MPPLYTQGMDGRRAEKRRYGILLAIVAATILIVGLLLKPQDKLRPSTQDARVDAVRADLNSLRELTQRNTLRNTSNRFSAMADADAAFLLETDQGQPAILWSDSGQLISAGHGMLSGLRIALQASPVTATATTWGAGLPLTVFQARHLTASAPSAVPIEDLEPGAWAIVVTLGPQGPEFVSGMYSGTGKTTCEGVDYNKILLNGPFDRRFLGAGMFDINGDLIAILAQCDGEIAAIPVAEISAHIADISRPERVPFAHLGFAIQAMSTPLDTLLSATYGMVITNVWTNWPAGVAGILAGDVLLTVNNAPAVSQQQVADALRTTPVQLRIQRAPHSILTITVDPQNGSQAVEVQSPTQGVLISGVAGATEKQLHLRAGDRILSVSGHPASTRSVLQILSTPPASPALLIVQRGTRQFLLVVPA